MNKAFLSTIFKLNNLGKVTSFQRIEIGFTNKVYFVNNEFIVKVCDDEANEQNFAKEVFFYSVFKNKIPVPDIIIYDTSKKLYNKHYIVYPSIKGDNLYLKWHLLCIEKRKNIVKQLCEILKIINQTPYKSFVEKFNIDTVISWQEKVVNKIYNSLEKISKKNILSTNLISVIKSFVTNNKNSLLEQKMALVYWDAHFDNILVQEDIIVGFLDFESTDFSSLDFVLDIIQRMVKYPKKYMSEESEKFAKKEDYADLLNWFKEFYPELFAFKNLKKRLDLYSIEHDLRTLLLYPNCKDTKQMIAKTVKFYKKIIFITGASGVGKTTILSNLKKESQNKNWSFLHFDSIGVPSTEVMIKEFGSPEKWQKAMTFKWIDDLIQGYHDKEFIILEGQVNFDFIKEGCAKYEFSNYKIVHIDCSENIMMKRLINHRKQPELATQDMQNWLKFLRKKAKSSGVSILDTSNISLNKTMKQFKSIIKNY